MSKISIIVSFLIAQSASQPPIQWSNPIVMGCHKTEHATKEL